MFCSADRGKPRFGFSLDRDLTFSPYSAVVEQLECLNSLYLKLSPPKMKIVYSRPASSDRSRATQLKNIARKLKERVSH